MAIQRAFYLYKNGDEIYPFRACYKQYGGKLDKLADRMFAYSGNDIVIQTEQKIDVTQYSKLCINVKYVNRNNNSGTFIGTNVDDSYRTSWYVPTQPYQSPSYNGVLTYDISSYTGEYYIDICINNQGEADIYEIWLEP